jgi:hypothetical protein
MANLTSRSHLPNVVCQLEAFRNRLRLRGLRIGECPACRIVANIELAVADTHVKLILRLRVEGPSEGPRSGLRMYDVCVSGTDVVLLLPSCCSSFVRIILIHSRCTGGLTHSVSRIGQSHVPVLAASLHVSSATTYVLRGSTDRESPTSVAGGWLASYMFNQ